MITEMGLKLENRIIPTGMSRKCFNTFLTKSLTSRCLKNGERGVVVGGGGLVQVPLCINGHLCHPNILSLSLPHAPSTPNPSNLLTCSNYIIVVFAGLIVLKLKCLVEILRAEVGSAPNPHGSSSVYYHFTVCFRFIYHRA
jgi:hypothetical protein